jgi:hypothetical protein
MKASTRISVSTGDDVWVRLTDKGAMRLKRYGQQLSDDKKSAFHSLRWTKEGWDRFPLWELMRIFGKECADMFIGGEILLTDPTE